MKSLKENKHSVTIRSTKYRNNKLNVATSTQKPDLNITCQKQTYHVYKSLLIQQCPYFSLMLGSNNFQEATNTTIDIKYDGDIFSLILEYIQTGEINLTSDNLEDICRAAIYFMLDDLKLFCCHLFKQQLNCQTVNYIHAFGNEYGVMELSKAALEFKENNFEKILESGVFLEWTMMFILQLLCSDLIRISSERKMLRFVLDWLRFPGFSERIKENAYEVLSKLRFSYLTKRNLDEVTDEMLAQTLTQVSTEFSRKITPPRIYHEGIYSLEFGFNPRFTRYCPTDCTITSLQSPYTGRTYVSMVVNSGKIYLINSVSLNESRRDNLAYLQLQVYDPFSDTWILLAPPTFAAFDFKLCSVGRCIYVFVSQTWDDLSYVTDIFMYCTDTDTWNTVPTEFPTELRSIHSVIACNGDIYIFPYHTSVNVPIFTPSTGEWSEFICEVRNIPMEYGIISYKSKLIFIKEHPWVREDITVYDTSTKEYKRYPCPNDTRFSVDTSGTYFTVYNGSIYFINDYLNFDDVDEIEKLDVDFMDGVSPIQLQRGWNTEVNIFGDLVSLDF